MEKQNENLRERLLARMPQPENLETYRKEVEASLQKNQRAFRREKWGVGALWLYVIAFFLVLTLYRGGNWISTPHGHLAEMTWLLLTLVGAVEILKHFVNRSRVEMLKEIRQVQLQILELQASVRKSGQNQP